ncbi:hypothetical protein NKH18_15520 [Streptomyces sp. M10(2022)]
MKSVRLFVVTVFCAMMVGVVSGVAAVDTGTTDIQATPSVDPDDSGWGRIPG